MKRSCFILSLLQEAERGYDDFRRERHYSDDARRTYHAQFPVGKLNTLEYGSFDPYRSIEYDNGIFHVLERIKTALSERALHYSQHGPHGNLLQKAALENYADMHGISHNDWNTLFIEYRDFLEFMSGGGRR